MLLPVSEYLVLIQPSIPQRCASTLHSNIRAYEIHLLHFRPLPPLPTIHHRRIQTPETLQLFLFPLINRARCKDGLLPLPQTRIYPLLNQHFRQIPSLRYIPFALLVQNMMCLPQHLVKIRRVIDITTSPERHGFVDGAVPPVAEQAGFEVFGRWGEVARILLVAEVAGCGAGGGGGGGVGAIEE